MQCPILPVVVGVAVGVAIHVVPALVAIIVVVLSSLLLSFFWLIVTFVVVVVVVILLFLLVVDCCHCCCSFVAAVVVLVGEEAFGFEFDIDGLAVLVIYMVVDFFFSQRATILIGTTWERKKALRPHELSHEQATHFLACAEEERKHCACREWTAPNTSAHSSSNGTRIIEIA